MQRDSKAAIAVQETLSTLLTWGTTLSLVGLVMVVGYWIVTAGFNAPLVFTGREDGVIVTPEQFQRIIDNAVTQAKVLGLCGVLFVLCSMSRWWAYQELGLALVVGGAAIAFGTPFAMDMLAGNNTTLPPGLEPLGSPRTIMTTSLLIVGAGGAAVGGFQLVLLGISAWIQSRRIRPRPTDENAQVAAQNRVAQDRFLGPCWTLPFCRDTVHKICPIRSTKKTCWREGRGCFCDQGVVLALSYTDRVAASRASGGYAGAARTVSVAKTGAQKREQCLGCPIYLHHQEQKYRITAPGIILGVIGLGWWLHTPFQQSYEPGLLWFGRQISGLSFGTEPGEVPAWVQDVATNSVIQWTVLVLIAVLLISYILHMAEWLLYKLGL